MRTDTALKAELYGVGVGPGDPGLVTIKAFSILSSVDIIFTPVSRMHDVSIAAEIIRGVGVDPAGFVPIGFPMARDSEALASAWELASSVVVESIDSGKKVAFITLGDPSVYSTWIYLRRSVAIQRPGTIVEVIPGIMAMNAAAACLGLPLVEGDEGLVLLPLPDPVETLDAFLPLVDRLVIYKIGGRLHDLARWVKMRGLEADARLVAGVGQSREMAGELLDIAAKAEGYLSVGLIGTARSVRRVPGTRADKNEEACR